MEQLADKNTDSGSESSIHCNFRKHAQIQCCVAQTAMRPSTTYVHVKCLNEEMIFSESSNLNNNHDLLKAFDKASENDAKSCYKATESTELYHSASSFKCQREMPDKVM